MFTYLPLLLVGHGCSYGLTLVLSVFSTISLCLQHKKHNSVNKSAV